METPLKRIFTNEIVNMNSIIMGRGISGASSVSHTHNLVGKEKGGT